MKGLHNKINNLSPFLHGTFPLDNSELKSDTGSLKFTQEFVNNQLMVKVQSKLIQNDNYYILLKGAKLMLFIAEKKELGKPIYVHHLHKNLFDGGEYEKLRMCEYMLPSDSYSIKRTFWNNEKNELKISLKKKYNDRVFNNNHKR